MPRITLPELDAQLGAIARHQSGLFTTKQAMDLGATSDQLVYRRRRGDFAPIAPLVFCLRGVPITDHLLLHAALLGAGGRSAVALSSAAALWKYPGFCLRPFQITRTRDGTFPPSTLGTVHATRRLPDSHLAEVDGLLVTTPTRTLFDLARVVRVERLERLIDHAWARRLTSGALLDRTLKELSGKGQTGITVMRELLAVRGPDHRPPESNLEARFGALMGDAGLGGFERQIELGDEAGWIGRVDFVHRARKVVVEVDSDLHHMSISDRRADAARRERLEAAGWTVLRVTEHEVWHRPDHVVVRIRAALVL